jgi:hypothetical protein
MPYSVSGQVTIKATEVSSSTSLPPCGITMDSDLYFRSTSAKRGPDPWSVTLVVFIIWVVVNLFQ